jgi:dipeptidyl aminopeptidase/acylaminoacyl peptidase
MGGSYGGYSCARLGFDSDLVKAAFIGNPWLDLSLNMPLNINDQYFWLKNDEDDVSKERRLRKLSPALEAPLPRVPVFMVGVQNDVRCPIAQSRAFANRFKEKNLPLTYLERSSGGHNSFFSHLELIKDFFEGKYGDERGHDRPEGYQVVVDSNQFFNK